MNEYKKIRILMIGLGSIGQRHLRNLYAHFGHDAEFLAYRVRGLQRTFSDTMAIRPGVSLEEEYHIRSFSDLDQALAEKPDLVYVTNITSMHIPCAMKAVEAGCDVFLEKPISNDAAGVSQLVQTARKNGCVVFVGFQNRYNPAVKMLRETVHSGKYGKIIAVHAELGERLTTMHTYENYAETYMARRDQGGGVVMNQLIHELDYLQWIFGQPDTVYALSGKNSTLSIDVEDYCDAVFQIRSSDGEFPISVHADFFQCPPTRRCKVVFEKGWASADLLTAAYTETVNDQAQVTGFPNFKRNDMFVEEMKDFLTAVKERRQQMLTLEDGMVSLRMALAIKRSVQENAVVTVDDEKEEC